MKRTLLLQILLGALLIAGYSANANASAFMTLTVGTTTVSCDNSLPFVVGGNCLGGVGFTTTPNGSSITFNRALLGRYAVLSVGLNTVPFGSQFGDIELGTFVSGLLPGSDILQIDFGVNGLTAPIGIQTLSATHSGFRTPEGGSGTETFRGWERNDNTLTPGPTGATAVSTTLPCILPTAPPHQCTGPTATFGGPNVTAPFALTGQAMINLEIDTLVQFTDTVALTPEPNTLVLLATGMLLVAATVRTRK